MQKFKVNIQSVPKIKSGNKQTDGGDYITFLANANIICKRAKAESD